MNAHRLGCILCFVMAILVALRPALALDLRKQIDPLAAALVEDEVVIGFVVGVFKDGETQVIGYGEMEQGKGNKPDGRTVYELGSISKVFTGILLADEIERGLVKLDDPVQKYLPMGVKMPIALDADNHEQPITLEHLTTHTSGLPRMPGNLKPADPRNPYADYTLDQMYDFLGNHKLRRPPGKHEYSNYAVALLGQILARRADTSYEQLLAKRITGPLAMRDTRIKLDDKLRRRLALPYNASLKPEKNWDLGTFVGAGGIRSTVDDMLLFIRANLADDDKPLTQAMKLAQKKQTDYDGGLAMCMGWHIARDRITRWHNGMTGGYHTWVAVVPGHGIGTVVLANTATPKITEFGEQVTRIAFGLEVKPPDRRKTVKVDPAVLASYVGKYELTPDFVLTVTVEDGQLMVQATGQEKLPIFATSPTEFFYKIVDARITFEADKDGKVEKLILHQNGRDMDAARRKK
jgi:CubicO group peptidase (beta-lactamase class C family)